ncbi:carboxylesterase/lipase family protein [Streptomyces sp. NPDC057257]|uniref:carboxylesterase/lipase family protein n=1 Tax=Streptomyces sp. NPDC057257 TaxID=3346071 RepID=UPI0036368CB5
MNTENSPHSASGPALGRRLFLGRSLAAAAAVTLAGSTSAYAADGKSSAALTGPVRTGTGRVSGVAAALTGVTVFKGIPFARSTAGALRWRPPQPAEPWSGVLKADTFGDICPQSSGQGAGAAASMTQSENCLNLNVWTAARSSDERRPVFVWIYGGGFSSGSGADPTFDGSALASQGLVVVTFNYRTGPFGFLAHPELSAEDAHGVSGNYGLLDQIAALKWVRRNIGAFGGDPGRVTIAGQSAGAGSVNVLLNSPLATGLFHGAIMESGVRDPHDPEIAALPTSYRTKEAAESAGTTWAKGKSATTLAELRALSATEVLDGSDTKDTTVTAPTLGNPPSFRPVLDGYVLARTYEETLTRGLQNAVPVLTGGNKDENGASPGTDTTVAKFRAMAGTKYGDLAEEFLALYPATTDAEADEQTNASARDSGRVSVHLWGTEFARHANTPVYTYWWEHVPPGASSQGAYHTSEIVYVFDSLYATDKAWTAADREIAKTLSAYVVNFVEHGDPNGRGLAHWPANDPHRPATMEVGDRFGRMELADAEKVAFFRRYYAAQRAW